MNELVVMQHSLLTVTIRKTSFVQWAFNKSAGLPPPTQLGSLHAHPSEKAHLPPLTKVIFNLAGVVEMDARYINDDVFFS